MIDSQRLFLHRDARTRTVDVDGGAQLNKLAALYDNGTLQPVVDRTFPFDETREAMA